MGLTGLKGIFWQGCVSFWRLQGTICFVLFFLSNFRRLPHMLVHCPLPILQSQQWLHPSHILSLWQWLFCPTLPSLRALVMTLSKDWREEFIKNFRTWLFALMERVGIQIHNNFHQESPHLSIINGVFSLPLTKHIYKGKKDLWMLQFGYGQVFPKDGKMTYNFTHTKINKQLSTAWDIVHSAESPVGAHHPNNSLINLM